MSEFPGPGSWLEGASFHHIGYATTSIERELPWFQSMGYSPSDAFVDAVQGVSGCFLSGAGPRIELLENLPESDTLTPWLTAGTRMYHLAYEVDDVSAMATRAKTLRGRLLVGPVPAVAFGGRSIAFVMLRNGLLLELIERNGNGR
jgi:methylmalonyl-CoA/ethylmalonyl-CoA epimerase